MAGKRVTIGPKPISTSEETIATKIVAAVEDASATRDTAAVELAREPENQEGTNRLLQDNVARAPEITAAPHPNVSAPQDVAAASPVDASTNSAIAGAPALRRTIAISAACGAVAGGVVAVGALMLASAYLMPVDPRVDVVERRVSAIETRTSENVAGIERLNGDIAQAIDSGQAAAVFISEQREQTSTLREELAALKDGLVADNQKQSPIFAVAVAQLRAAFIAGLPFETELVNVYSLAKQDGEMVSTLTELLGAARTGVPNATALRGILGGIVAATPGLQLGGPQSYYQYGLALVNEYVGYSSTPYAVEFANSALTDADGRLARGDVSGAISVLEDVDPSIQRTLAPFLENARFHERINAAITRINDQVVADLRERKGA